jgi:hypothetical protein
MKSLSLLSLENTHQNTKPFTWILVDDDDDLLKLLSLGVILYQWPTT